MVEDYAIFGGGGFGRELYCNINEVVKEKKLDWNFLGFFDDHTANFHLFSRLGPFLGNIEKLNNWPTELNVFIAISEPKVRKIVSQKIENINVRFPNFIYSDVRLLEKESFEIGIGNIIGSKCSISLEVKIGDFNVFLNSTTIGHDSSLGNFNTFLPGSRIAGNIKMGDANQFGMNSTINQNLTIGDSNKIAPNTWLSRSIKDGGIYYAGMMKKL
jgi:acetyltransferase-like isoleucine patch superfamily enzyme